MSNANPRESLGRELAVEALMDMHEGGPAHRVAKIMVSSYEYGERNTLKSIDLSNMTWNER
eukprot:scaffold231_cov258-Chaetoceros_neogracile.AAC.18